MTMKLQKLDRSFRTLTGEHMIFYHRGFSVVKGEGSSCFKLHFEIYFVTRKCYCSWGYWNIWKFVILITVIVVVS